MRLSRRTLYYKGLVLLLLLLLLTRSVVVAFPDGRGTSSSISNRHRRSSSSPQQLTTPMTSSAATSGIGVAGPGRTLLFQMNTGVVSRSSTIAETIRAIIVGVQTSQRSSPTFLPGFVLSWLGNPVVFFSFFQYVRRDFQYVRREHYMFGVVPAFQETGTNCLWMNPLPYVVYTLPLYTAWVVLNIMVIPKFFPTKSQYSFDVHVFLSSYNVFKSIWSVVASLPNWFNLYFWCGTSMGMEGNIMGMVICPPLVLATVANFVLWVNAIRRACVVQK
jgi:hypothetical protein